MCDAADNLLHIALCTEMMHQLGSEKPPQQRLHAIVCSMPGTRYMHLE